MCDAQRTDRRDFIRQGARAGAAAPGYWAAMSAGAQPAAARERSAPRIRVGVIGCGSVAGPYLNHLPRSPHVEMVSACDSGKNENLSYARPGANRNGEDDGVFAAVRKPLRPCASRSPRVGDQHEWLAGR